ncbi:hypothetical protein NS07_v2contig00178-0001 [Nocardia seriolae]|nr:hypothetical protein NS07_v2contig00178-0001 [Nocardia seriolae]
MSVHSPVPGGELLEAGDDIVTAGELGDHVLADADHFEDGLLAAPAKAFFEP